MYCPLCKAEYRQGFTTCSDCQIALVATQQEVDAVAVDRLWTGDNRKKMEKILDGLMDAEIPFRSKETLKSHPWPWLSMLLFRFMKPRPTFEFHVDVMNKDSAKSKEVLRKIIEDAEKVDEEED
jgi:hypothetical protein